MGDIFVRSYLIARDQASLDKAVERYARAAESIKSVPGVKAFGVCLPNGTQSGAFASNDDPLTVQIVERYENDQVRGHIHADDNIARCRNESGSLFSTQTIIVSEAATTFIREDQVAIAQSPFIVTATFPYQTGRASEALVGWREFLQYMQQQEIETYAYSVFKSLDTLTTFEVYSSAEYVKDVHIKSPAIKANGAQNGHWRIPGTIFATKWHLAGGFLSRD